MNCENCQHKLPKEAKFCPECGEKVNSQNISSVDPKTNSTNYSRPFTKPIHAFGLIISAVVTAILIIIFILDSNQKKIEENRNNSSNTLDLSPEIKVQLEKLASDPESIPLNIKIGNLFFDINRFNEAIPFYKKALSLDSTNIGVQIDLAVCFFNLRNFDQAIVEMDKALKIDPNHAKGLFNMGIIYYNLGKFDEARKWWERLINEKPELMEAKRAQELLQNLPQE